MCKFYAEYMYVCGHAKAFHEVPHSDHVIYMTCRRGPCPSGDKEEFTSFPIFKNCSDCGRFGAPRVTPAFPFNYGITFTKYDPMAPGETARRVANDLLNRYRSPQLLSESGLEAQTAVLGTPLGNPTQRV
ncbi:hypothetical protein SBRCBS47491_001930 [Sporothrix bragantina]|uniref:Uncharacterized protein n=1 Tax=Sporothrix bragantina TaxID=671064 RepID=A0ABP0B2M8_9PEZI